MKNTFYFSVKDKGGLPAGGKSLSWDLQRASCGSGRGWKATERQENCRSEKYWIRMIIMIMIFIIKLGIQAFKTSSHEKLALEGSSVYQRSCPPSKVWHAASESPPLAVPHQKASFHYFSDSLEKGLPSIYPWG